MADLIDLAAERGKRRPPAPKPAEPPPVLTVQLFPDGLVRVRLADRVTARDQFDWVRARLGTARRLINEMERDGIPPTR